MRNIYPNLIVKMLSGNEKNLYNIIFPDFGCMYSRMCVHARYIYSWQEKQLIGSWGELYTDNILFLTKNRQSVFFCLLLKETWFCFIHNTVLHRRAVLCLNISTPLTFSAFSKLMTYFPHQYPPVHIVRKQTFSAKKLALESQLKGSQFSNSL